MTTGKKPNLGTQNNRNQDEIVFRPRAKIMRILGQELISSETVALIELVKNAYDADATKVLIRFNKPLEKGKGSIEVLDNGHGMAMGTVKSAWMEPATQSKRTRQRSEKKNRRLLGEKGVGRFACSRIASELELITRRRTENTETYALFDWSQFDNEEQYLDEIGVLIEERTPEVICKGGEIETLWADESAEIPEADDLHHGTILRMNYLNKSWSRPDFRNLQRDLSRLVSPFVQFSDFSIRIELPDEYSEYSKEITPPKIIRYPHYSIKGSVDENGNYEFTLHVYATGASRKYSGQFLWSVHEEEPELMMLSEEESKELIGSLSDGEYKSRKIQTGPFDVELRIWDRDELGNVSQKTGSTISDIRQDLDAVAGINIYRDGFRVLPYGEPQDDWLRLDIRRVKKPTLRLSNNQIVGYVSITADQNPKLKDQSNREGLDENQALEDLRSVLIQMLNQVEVTRYSLRPRKRRQTVSTPMQGLFNAIDLDKVLVEVKNKYPKDVPTQQLIIDTQKSLNEQIEEIQVVITRYQRLATLGTLIDVILHDGRHPLSSIVRQAILGQTSIRKTKEFNEVLLQNLLERFAKIEDQGKLLSSLFDRIEPFGGRKRGKPSQLYLEKVIESALAIFESEINKRGIKVFLPESETLVRIDQAEIQQVFINLLQNSIYWLEYVEKSKRKIIITIERKAVDHIEIIFADSGPGVPPDYKDKIFDPYFSTKPNGVGLGLAIAGEIITDYYNGGLELIDSGPLEGAVFRITLRKRG